MIPAVCRAGRRRIAPLPILVALLAWASVPAAAPIDSTWARLWRQDLEFVRTEIPRVHANAFHSLSREGWNQAIDDLEGRVPTLEQHQITVALATLIAKIGDGHTRLTLPVDPGFGRAVTHTPTPEPKDPSLRLHYLPIRLYLYEDGLFVREIDAAHARFAGAKVTRIGGMTADEAMAAVAPTIQRDNAQQVASQWPVHLMIPELLHAVGVTADPRKAAFEFEIASGKRTTVVLEAVPWKGDVRWVAAGGAGEPPLYRRRGDERFWSEELPAVGAVYVRLNEIQDREGERLSEFADRIFDAFDAGPARRMIVDLRGNPGGDNGLNRPLVHRAICSPKLKAPGSFFVVIDRGTFSAAMNLVIDLERNTSAVFVGEPTGASPNSYGDSRKTTLPNTGLTIRASTLYWQNSDPRDDRPFVAPHLAIPLASRDDTERRDPVLEALSRFWSGPAEPAGTWSGVATYGPSRFPVSLEFEREGNAWRGWCSAEALGARRAPVGSIGAEGGVLSFDLPTPEGAASFRIRIGSDMMSGTVSLQGTTIPIAARRAN